MTTVMKLSTLYFLFGSDLRHWFTNKDADIYFYILLVIAFEFFGIELLMLVHSCLKDDFNYSFFFWLDFIATFSLVLDVSWLVDIFNNMFNLPLSYTTNDVILEKSQVLRIQLRFRLLNCLDWWGLSELSSCTTMPWYQK